MKTTAEINERLAEIEETMKKQGYTEDAIKEAVNDAQAEMELNMENAIAIAKSDEATIFITDMYECGYALNTKLNGVWDYDDGYTATEAMKRFCELAREHKVPKCNVSTKWLDKSYLEELDRQKAQWRKEEEYADACMASEYGDDSLMRRYERKYGIEKDYGPSNPWDAPGMSVRDFI